MQHPRWLVPTLILFLLIGNDVFGLPDSTDEEHILFITNLNGDCVSDTATGVRNDDGYVLKRILWGQPLRDIQDSSCQSRTPRQKRIRQTVFTYPGWKVTGGSVAFQRVNGDGLDDIVLHIKGTVKGIDTLRSIVLFAQHGLDSVRVIHIGGIARFQSRPFFAMDLVPGSELTQPGIRDLSGNTSYVLEPVDLNVDEQDSMPPPTSPLAGIDSRRNSVQVYPNPTGRTISIGASELEAGAYELQIISVNGDMVLQENMRVEPGESLQRTLDVQNIPSGYYVVRIENEEGHKEVGIYPIIITR